eukprot:SAG31_NODE_10582_length_1121_cov_1.454990_2_plen_63_part_00
MVYDAQKFENHDRGLIGDRALQLFSAVSLGDQNEVERLVAQGEPVNVELPAEIDGWSYLSPL